MQYIAKSSCSHHVAVKKFIDIATFNLFVVMLTCPRCHKKRRVVDCWPAT
jgi:hypothetical protein